MADMSYLLLNTLSLCCSRKIRLKKYHRESSKTKIKNDPDVHTRPGRSYFYWSRGVNQYFYIPEYFFKHVSVLILMYRMWIFLTPLAISKSTTSTVGSFLRVRPYLLAASGFSGCWWSLVGSAPRWTVWSHRRLHPGLSRQQFLDRRYEPASVPEAAVATKSSLPVMWQPHHSASTWIKTLYVLTTNETPWWTREVEA